MNLRSKNIKYLYLVLLSVLIFILAAILSSIKISDFEKSVFLFVNGFPGWLHWPLWIFSLLGTLGAVLVISLICLLRKRKLLSVYILVGGITSYALAYGLKLLDFRARPGAVLLEANVREASDATLGFPSGHAAVASVITLFLLLYIPRKWFTYLIFVAIAVGVSRLYLGVHLPLDLVGGFAIGLFVFSIIMLFSNNLIHRGLPKSLNKNVSYKSLVALFVISLVLVFVFSRFESFKLSLNTLKNADLKFVILAIIFSLSTYFFASLSYKSLIFYKIKYIKILIIQISSGFASKIVPSGIGGIAINTRFLTKNKHTITSAASIATINNLMGFVGHTALLLLVIIFSSGSISQNFSFSIGLPALLWATVAAIIMLFFIFLLALPNLRNTISRIFNQVKKDLNIYTKSPNKLLGSFLASLLITLSYSAALYASANALGSSLSPLQILVIFTLGVAAASITPTPGGLGGVEAALVTAFTATGLDTGQAIAITLLYRLVTYWLPILPGFIAFQYSLNKDYI